DHCAPKYPSPLAALLAMPKFALTPQEKYGTQSVIRVDQAAARQFVRTPALFEAHLRPGERLPPDYSAHAPSQQTDVPEPSAFLFVALLSWPRGCDRP